MSEIISLKNGSYEYKIPSPPSREEDILFSQYKKKEQYWRTPPLPDFRRMNVREKVKYIDTDRERWANGVHMMIKGELTYINGLHWNHLVHMTYGGKKAYYLDHQRLNFYFRQLSWEAPKCRCRVIAKGRRVGATMEEMDEADYRASEDFNRHVALVSIEERKTKETLFNPIVDSYVKKLKHMRANFYKPNGKKPKQKLLMALDDLDEDTEYQQDMDRLDLGSWIIPFPTSVSALDAYLVHYATVDEIFKWTSCDPEEFLKTSLPCFDDGGVKLGIPSLLSTLGDSDDMLKAVEAGIKIYAESDVKNLLPNGYTVSGCWNWFISAVFSFRSKEYRDIYGKINIDKATKKILEDRSRFEEGSPAWIQEVRRHPLTEEEAMATALGSATFDNIRLQDRITIINKLPTNEKPYVLGKLHEDGVTEKIHFEPTNNGNWQVAWHPKKSRLDGKDFSNRWYKDMNGILRMNKSPEGVFGYDPVQYGDKQTSSNNLSKSAIIGKYKFDYFDNKDKFGRSCAGQYAGLYHYRDEDPEISHYEFLKAMKYWGFMGMHERLVSSVYKSFKDWYALNFLLKGDGKVHGMWTDGKQHVIKNAINKFQKLIKRPLIGDHDFLKDIPFEVLLIQAKELNPSDTRKSDVFMANSMMDAGLEKIFFADVIDEMMEEYGMNDTTLATMFGK